MLIVERLKRQTFSPSEQEVVAFILDRPQELERLSMQALAKLTFTQPSALVRLAKKLGFTGWRDFKQEYLEEWRYLNKSFTKLDANLPFTASDNIMKIAHKLADLEQSSIADLLSLLNHDSLNQAKLILLKAKSIKIFAQSANLLIAQDFALKMNRIGKKTELAHIPGEEVYEAYNLAPDSCAIIISYTGQNPQLLKINQIIRQAGLATIAITSIGDNQLSKEASCFLPITTREKLYSKIANFSINISIIYLLDVLYSIVFAQDYDKQLNHLKQTGQLVDVRKSVTDILKEDD